MCGAGEYVERIVADVRNGVEYCLSRENTISLIYDNDCFEIVLYVSKKKNFTTLGKTITEGLKDAIMKKILTATAEGIPSSYYPLMLTCRARSPWNRHWKSRV